MTSTNKSLVSIDLSMRCAGIVALDKSGVLEDMLIVPTTMETFDHEYLLLHMERRVLSFMANLLNPTALVIEGLSFGSQSGSADLIAANWWNTRKEVLLEYPAIKIGIIPVSAWRSKVIDTSKVGKALLLEKYGKAYLKMAVKDATPAHVLERFEAYLAKVEWPPKYTASKKREAIYDLCDAYWLGRHRLNIGPI